MIRSFLAVRKNKLKSAEDQLISTREELSSTRDELADTKKTLSRTKKDLASTKAKLQEVEAIPKPSKSSLRRAAIRGASTALAVVHSHHPDLDYNQIKTGMKCSSVEEATALCRWFGPTATEFVKMANIVSDSSSSEAEN